MSVQEILAKHQFSGITKFSHGGGNCYVVWPKCLCGWSDHPNRQGRHLLDALAEAGYSVAEVTE